MLRMLVAARVLLATVSAIVGFPDYAAARKRVALVVGNSAYLYTPRLNNPKNDATDMASALKKVGFQVLEGFDLDKPAFDRKVRDFAVALEGAAVGVFFFAGHGLQVSGQNYLVPVDAQLTTAAALEFEMMRVDVVHRVMERSTRTNVLFLDACRDNPLSRNLALSMGTRSTEIGRGLALIESGVGTLISFSTQPGNVALDGAGRNSPFAGALVKHLSTSNDDLNAILIAVRNDVMSETRDSQVPWEHSALRGRFYFNPTGQAAEPTKVAPARLSEAAEAWGATKDATSAAVLEAFIARYRDTFYAELARARIEDLAKQDTPVATPKKLSTSVPFGQVTEDAFGVWLNPENNSHMELYRCGEGLCAKVSKITDEQKTDDKNPDAAKKSRPIVGLVIMDGAKKTGDNKWAGTLYNRADGKSYSGTLTVKSKNAVDLSGCVAAVFCKTTTFSRVN